MRAQLEPYGCGTVSLHWECSKLFANTPQTSGNRTRTKCLSNWYITQAQDHHIHGQCTIQTRTLDFHCISLTIQVDPIPQGAKWWVAPRKINHPGGSPPPKSMLKCLSKALPKKESWICYVYIYIYVCVCVFLLVCVCVCFPVFPEVFPETPRQPRPLPFWDSESPKRFVPSCTWPKLAAATQGAPKAAWNATSPSWHLTSAEWWETWCLRFFMHK